MNFSSVDRLDSAAQSAEAASQRGDFGEAFTQYAKVFSQRLAYSTYGLGQGERLGVTDFFVLERLSDLAILMGYGEQADKLFKLSSSQIREAGNDYWADILTVKRIKLNLDFGRLRDAQKMLSSMSKTIGDIQQIQFTPPGFKRWEAACDWSNTVTINDRSTIFLLLYLVMGQLLAALGQYSDAEAAMEAGLAHRLRPHEISEVYPIPDDMGLRAVDWLRLGLATVRLEKGAIGSAHTSVSELKTSINSQQQPAMWVQTLELEGKISWLSGNLGQALSCFRDVLHYCIEKGFTRAAVPATLNLAEVLILLNQTLDARRHIEVARAEAKAVNDLALCARAERLLQIAFARTQAFPNEVPFAQSVTEQWKAKEAKNLDSKIDEQNVRVSDKFTVAVNPLELQESRNYLTFFDERVLGFHWLLAHRDIAGCAHWLAQLKKIFRFTDSRLIAVRLEVLSGLLAYHSGDFVGAEKLLTAAQLELRQLNLLKELWQAQRILRWCRRRRLGSASDLDEETTTESGELLRRMADTLQAGDRSFFFFNKWTDEEEELALLINRLKNRKDEIPKAAWYRRFYLRRQWKTEFKGLLRFLDRYRDVRAKQSIDQTASPREHDETRRSLQDISPPPSIWQRLRRLKWRHATISFLVLPDRVFVVHSTLLGVNFEIIDATRLELRELIRQWYEIIVPIREKQNRELGKTPGETDVAISVPELIARSQQLSSKLSEKLQLSTILGRLPWFTKNLTLVLDDCLHGFPFAAITHDGKYLIEHYALSFAYREQPPSPPSRRSTSALLVGASLKNQGMEALAFVSEELEAVEAWLRRWKLLPQNFDDARAAYPKPDKATILASLPRAAIAHFACHGLFTPDEPAQSGIVLKLRPKREMLTLQELSKVDLSDVLHVTLSSCWSADYFIFPGRWVVSLPETLGRAGAASVLGCLWVVDDRVGSAFIAQFYSYLERYGRAKALQYAQRDCLNGTLGKKIGVNVRQPIFWAGYQLYGQSGRLEL